MVLLIPWVQRAFAVAGSPPPCSCRPRPPPRPHWPPSSYRGYFLFCIGQPDNTILVPKMEEFDENDTALLTILSLATSMLRVVDRFPAGVMVCIMSVAP